MSVPVVAFPATGAADIISSLAALAWPVLVGVLVLRAAPALLDVLRDRDFRGRAGPSGVELEVGGQPLSYQQAVDEQRREVEALRSQLSLVATEIENLKVLKVQSEDTAPVSLEATLAVPSEPLTGDEELTATAAPAQLNPSAPRRVLWVDDRPTSNAYETAALRDRDIEVVQAETTADAMKLLASDMAFDAIVTGLDRVEDGASKPLAGLDLVERLRDGGPSVPIFVYTTAESAMRHGRTLLAHGALGVASDSTQLLELLGVNFGPGYALRLMREVRQLFQDSNLDPHDQPGVGVDFVLETEDEARIGIEVKAWLGTIHPQAVTHLIYRLEATAEQHDLTQVWLVTPAPIKSVGTDSEVGRVRLLTFDELREELQRSLGLVSGEG